MTWNTTTWKRTSSKRIVRDPISAFNVSADGKLISIGTIQGDIYIINSTSMQVQMVVRKAHLGLVTALMFAQDSRFYFLVYQFLPMQISFVNLF